MKNLVEALETACAKGAVEGDIFLKLKREMAAAQTLVDTVKV